MRVRERPLPHQVSIQGGFQAFPGERRYRFPPKAAERSCLSKTPPIPSWLGPKKTPVPVPRSFPLHPQPCPFLTNSSSARSKVFAFAAFRSV